MFRGFVLILAEFLMGLYTIGSRLSLSLLVCSLQEKEKVGKVGEEEQRQSEGLIFQRPKRNLDDASFSAERR